VDFKKSLKTLKSVCPQFAHIKRVRMRKCKLRLMIWVSVICLFLSSSQGIYAGELIDAAKQGDLAKAKTQIEARGAKVDETGPDNTTPLIWASYNGHLDVVKYLLVKGADINHKETGHGKNALMLAAEEGHLSVVKLLIEKKANVSAINNYGGTSLMAAAQNGHLNSILVLLSHGSKIDHKGNEGQTALMLACGKGHLPAVKLLISKGSDFKLRDNAGRTPEDWAKIAGHHNIASYLQAYSTRKRTRALPTTIKD